MSFQLEVVEPRRLLSVALQDGTLNIAGTESADRIIVSPLRGDPSLLRMSFNGQVSRFSGSDVQLIVIDSGAGRDTIILSGVKVNTQVNAGVGADRIFGGANRDVIDGGAGNDVIRGGAGDDDLRGSDGDDKVFGEAGNDFVGGGDGIDRIFGGRGADQFGVLGTQEERKDFSDRDGDSVQRFSSGGGATVSFAPIVGSVSAPIIPGPTARLDIGRNALVLDYPPADPIASIRNLIATGYASGSWNGYGITAGTLLSDADLMPAGQSSGDAVPIADLVLLWRNLGSAEFDRLMSNAFASN